MGEIDVVSPDGKERFTLVEQLDAPPKVRKGGGRSSFSQRERRKYGE